MNLKDDLKIKAAKIRKDKIKTKTRQKAGEYAGDLQYSLLKQRRDYRHRHIAYSMLRGRTYDQIESKCREDNKPNMDLIKELMDEYSKDNVCVGT